jgi:hypothetical protein
LFPLAPAIAALLHWWMSNGLKGPAGNEWPLPGTNLDDPAAYLFPGLTLGGTGPKRNRRIFDKFLSVRGYRDRLKDAAALLEHERSDDNRHPFGGFPLERLGTHSFKRSAVTLMKDTCASTSLVAAIAGTTAKTLERVYDTPTWKRQTTLVIKTFNPLADTLRDQQATGSEAPSVGCCSQCTKACLNHSRASVERAVLPTRPVLPRTASLAQSGCIGCRQKDSEPSSVRMYWM